MVDKMIMQFSKISTFRVNNSFREYGVCILISVSHVFFLEYEMIMTTGRAKVNKFEGERGEISVLQSIRNVRLQQKLFKNH